MKESFRDRRKKRGIWARVTRQKRSPRGASLLPGGVWLLVDRLRGRNYRRVVAAAAGVRRGRGIVLQHVADVVARGAGVRFQHLLAGELLAELERLDKP